MLMIFLQNYTTGCILGACPNPGCSGRNGIRRKNRGMSEVDTV